MDLWIRNQDRNLLTNVKKIYISSNGAYSDDLKLFFIKNEEYILGKYKTEERALEVLDEIQNIINAKTIIKFQCFVPEERIKQVKEAIDKYSIIELPDYEIKQLAGVIIYEMPKE